MSARQSLRCFLCSADVPELGEDGQIRQTHEAHRIAMYFCRPECKRAYTQMDQFCTLSLAPHPGNRNTGYISAVEAYDSAQLTALRLYQDECKTYFETKSPFRRGPPRKTVSQLADERAVRDARKLVGLLHRMTCFAGGIEDCNPESDLPKEERQ